jgi:hypothetical protein
MKGNLLMDLQVEGGGRKPANPFAQIKQRFVRGEKHRQKVIFVIPFCCSCYQGCQMVCFQIKNHTSG